MKASKLLVSSVLALSLVGGVAACSTTSSNGNNIESKQQQQDTLNLERSQPLPAVFYSQERENLIDIELAEVNVVRTTSFVPTMTGDALLYSCPSIGFGIPDSASLSNPSQIGWNYNGWGNGRMDSGVIGQMDPNGIYAPTASEGTWIICLSTTGQPYISRFEDRTDTVGGPAEWVVHPANGQHIVMTGAPTALANTVVGKRPAQDKRTYVKPSANPNK